MAYIITSKGASEIDISPEVINELTDRYLREDVVRHDLEMYRCVEEAKWQAETRRFAAPTRFLCSVPAGLFIKGLQEDPYYWHDKKVVKHFLSENNRMTGD